MSKRPPKASAEATRDAAAVLAVHPEAQAFFDRENNLVHVSVETMHREGRDNIEMQYQQLGIGCSAESAWADARRNVERPPIPELPATGSPTWSLKSDEVFWNAQKAKSLSAVATAQAQRASYNAGNEGEANLSKLKM